MHSRMIMREKEIFYKSKLSLTPKRKVASYVGRLCEEGKKATPPIRTILTYKPFINCKHKKTTPFCGVVCYT